MQFFIGLVPPANWMEQVMALRSRYGLVNITEPHITVKAQPGLTPDLAWMKQVEAVCAELQPFTVQLGAPAWFGTDVLYLRVQGADVERLHRLLVAAVAPDPDDSERYQELDRYVPHLTLAQTAHGATAEQLAQMQQEAQASFSSPPAFDVQFLRVYRKTPGDTGYVKALDIPFGS